MTQVAHNGFLLGCALLDMYAFPLGGSLSISSSVCLAWFLLLLPLQMSILILSQEESALVDTDPRRNILSGRYRVTVTNSLQWFPVFLHRTCQAVYTLLCLYLPCSHQTQALQNLQQKSLCPIQYSFSNIISAT